MRTSVRAEESGASRMTTRGSNATAEGIVFGMLKLITGEHKEITPLMYGLTVLFVAKCLV